ncbi:MAG: helix-turn-helix transcriptional regulator [Armatimonadetes bacterium]|nr:helix-turn-helix transcriptional regulator [Armatimonadota bacterium]
MATPGQRIREARTALGVELDQLADQTGLSLHDLVQIERDEVEPDLEILTTIGDFLGIDFEEQEASVRPD